MKIEDGKKEDGKIEERRWKDRRTTKSKVGNHAQRNNKAGLPFVSLLSVCSYLHVSHFATFSFAFYNHHALYVL